MKRFRNPRKTSRRMQMPGAAYPSLRDRLLLFVTAILMLSAIALSSCRPAEKEPVPPNVILIISDDQGWTDYGFMNHPHIATPHIDRLAGGGLTFTRGYVAAPLCRPSLASMSTGLYPHQHRILGNDPVFQSGERRYSEPWLVDRSKVNQALIDRFRDLPNLAALLTEAGYATLQTGKWWEGHPENGGFTEAMTHGDPARGGRHGDEGLTIGREGMDVVFDFIERADAKDTPFFVWYAPFMPHTPHTPPDSLFQKYLPLAGNEPVAAYWAMCEWFDITCGQLMDFIEGKGLAENTLFVYVCDNGWIQDPETRNRFAPHSKTSPYEMGIRTPIMFRWTGTIEPVTDDRTLVSSIDLAPTILEACGLETPPGMEGLNVLDPQALSGREAIFAETNTHDFTTVDSSLLFRIILRNQWKMILPEPANLPKSIRGTYEPDTLLFDVVADPFEKHNLYHECPDMARDLLDRLEVWWEETQP